MTRVRPATSARAFVEMATALAALLVVASLAGCGGGHHHSGGMMNGSGGMMNGGRTGAPPGPNAERAPDTGRLLFRASGCGGCHTFADAGASGNAGPNLDRVRPGFARVIEQVTNGGGGMPAYGSSLTSAQIAAIARYVSRSTR